ncbi:MAG: hypothetical protein AUG48_11425 [Actinobacteria bacterium 13_1_20CM_3_68_9]|nr:MAG: hypothetical protein AUG48_11425 [Actinobacteria bacterium 13_1_20CM_3_68_9]
MLLGEGLAGRHQGGLASGLDRPQHRVQGNGCLAAADLPHQQSLHRPCRREIAVDVGDRAPLIAGELERQRLEPALDRLARLAERRAGSPCLATLAARRERRLVQEELLERQAVARPIRAGEGVGEVGRRQGVPGAGEAPASSKLGRQRLQRVAGQRLYLPGPVADPLGAQALGGRVHGHEPRRVNSGGAVGAGDLVGLDPEGGAVELAIEQQPHALAQPVREPRLVEPDRRCRPRVVRHGRLHDGQAAPAGPPEPH